MYNKDKLGLYALCSFLKGGAFLEGIRQYWKRTDKFYLLLCIFSSTMAVVALASWATKQGNGFAVDELTGAITGIGDYRRAVVQGGAAVLGLCVALLLSCIDYRSLVKVWPVHVAVTWNIRPSWVIREVAQDATPQVCCCWIVCSRLAAYSLP